MKADLETLNGLHEQMAAYFNDLLSGGERLAPGELSAILKFLKDNEITADIIESKPMANLVQSFLEKEDQLFDSEMH